MNAIQLALNQARRVEQSYPWGQVVWHVWSHGKNLKPLVLFHGGSGSWTHWVRNVNTLAQTREVWVLDTPGFGDSDLPPQARDADDLVPFVAEVLQKTFESEPVAVLGFSFGGMLAGLVAAQHPHLFSCMVLIGVPGLGLFGEELPMRGMMAGMSEAQQRDVHRHNLKTIMLRDETLITDALIDLQQANVARDRLRRRRIARTDILAQIQHAWTCPVYGIWGEQDALYKDRLHHIPQVLKVLRSFTLVPEAGHWVMYEKPEAFHTIVNALLRQN